MGFPELGTQEHGECIPSHRLPSPGLPVRRKRIRCPQFPPACVVEKLEFPGYLRKPRCQRDGRFHGRDELRSWKREAYSQRLDVPRPHTSCKSSHFIIMFQISTHYIRCCGINHRTRSTCLSARSGSAGQTRITTTFVGGTSIESKRVKIRWIPTDSVASQAILSVPTHRIPLDTNSRIMTTETKIASLLLTPHSIWTKRRRTRPSALMSWATQCLIAKHRMFGWSCFPSRHGRTMNTIAIFGLKSMA